jgi:hypothetical protein
MAPTTNCLSKRGRTADIRTLKIPAVNTQWATPQTTIKWKDAAMLEEARSELEEAAVRNSTIAKERRQLVGVHSKSRKAAAIPSSSAKRPQLQQEQEAALTHTRRPQTCITPTQQ